MNALKAELVLRKALLIAQDPLLRVHVLDHFWQRFTKHGERVWQGKLTATGLFSRLEHIHSESCACTAPVKLKTSHTV